MSDQRPAIEDAFTARHQRRKRSGSGQPNTPPEQRRNGEAHPAAQSGLEPLPLSPDVEPARPPFRIVRWESLDGLPQARPLIKHVLDLGGMSLIYGPSGCGKTFFALDLAIHVALGWAWRGRKTQKGRVLYIAAEAGEGIARRLAAFRLYHKVAEDGVDFFVMPEGLDMCSGPEQTAQLARELAALEEGERFGLIVVDTLSRVLAGGDENASDDMGALVMNVDRLRQATGAHVALIHHSGKAEGSKERGHSALRAAADTVIAVEANATTKLHTAEITKQRDGEVGQIFAFRLPVVELGSDEDNEAVTSCAVETDDEPESLPGKRARPLPAAAKVARDLLRKAIEEEGEPVPASRHVPRNARGVKVVRWRAYVKAGSGIASSDKEDAQRKAFQRALQKLQADGLIGVWHDFVWLTGR